MTNAPLVISSRGANPCTTNPAPDDHPEEDCRPAASPPVFARMHGLCHRGRRAGYTASFALTDRETQALAAPRTIAALAPSERWDGQVQAGYALASAFSPDGKYLATGGRTESLSLGRQELADCPQTLPAPEMISATTFSPDSRPLLTGGFSQFTVRNRVQVTALDISACPAPCGRGTRRYCVKR